MKKLKKIFFMFILLTCFGFIKQVYARTENTPTYDITGFKIYNDDGKQKIDISGWAYINMMNNGIYKNNELVQTPYYEICVKDENNNNVVCGSYYRESFPKKTPFSLTCILMYGHNNRNVQDCMNFEQNQNYNSRNEIINNNQPNYYYDSVDFKITIDSLSSLKADEKYYLELKMKIGNHWSDPVKLSVFEDSVQNNIEEDITVSDKTDLATVVVEDALMQKYSDFSNSTAAPIKDQCYFAQGSEYKYIDSKKFFSGRTEHDVTYYAYQLDLSNGFYDGNCSGVFEKYDYAGAHAAWVQPNINTYIKISKNNPCINGEGGLSATEYAIKNPGVCCDEIPETCCGNKVYIDKVIENKDDNYKDQQFILGSDYCCYNNDKYPINTVEAYVNQPFYTFKHYITNDLESFKNTYWKNFDSTKRYTNEYVNRICSTKRWSGRTCPTGTTKDEESISYSMNKVSYSSGTSTKNLEAYIYLDEKPSKITGDVIAYDYFSENDFKTSGNAGYKSYSLSNEHFEVDENSIQITGPKKIGDKYRYTIKFKIIIHDTSNINLYNSKYYYIPVKFWYCETAEKMNCKDPEYFDEHLDVCCTPDSNDPKCKCNLSKEKCYSWAENASCKANEATWSSGSSPVTNNKQTYETITFKNYPALKSSELEVEAGTGFAYNINNIEHKVINEGSYPERTECTGDGCLSGLKINVQNYYNELKRPIDIDKQRISNFNYKFNGGNQTENYEISDINGREYILEYDTITLKEYVYVPNPLTGIPSKKLNYEETVSYPSKIEYNYTYKLSFKNKYIAKLQNSSDDAVNITTTKDESNYLDGGKEFYTKLTTTTGIYNIDIRLNGNGLTGYLSNDKNFTCQYKVTKGIKTVREEASTGKYYFRPISLSNPFPNNRPIGSNWTSNDRIDTYIKDSGNSVYSDAMYEVTLDSELIRQIKSYNNEYDYGWNNMTHYSGEQYMSTSNFFKDSSINWERGVNLKLAEDDIRKIKVGDF